MAPTLAPTSPGPNIAITGFVSVTDQILAGAQSTGRVSVVNNGPLEVGQFFVGVTWAGDDGLSEGFTSPVSIDGMVPGQSVDVTVDLSLANAGNYTFTAMADTDNVLKESNEDDNSKTLGVTAVSLPNLKFSSAVIGLDQYIPTGVDQNGQVTYDYTWKFTVDIDNTGSVAAPPFAVALFYYDAGGNLVKQANYAQINESIPPGGRLSEEELYENITPNSPTAYLQLDPDDLIAEFDETDNQQALTVPWSQ